MSERRSVTVTLDTENAAFRGDGSDETEALDREEVAGLLRVAADKIAAGRDNGALIDHNGNPVGSFLVSE